MISMAYPEKLRIDKDFIVRGLAKTFDITKELKQTYAAIQEYWNKYDPLSRISCE